MLTYAKAVLAALIAGLGTLGTALLDNSVAPIEWVGIASTTLVALYGVWQVPNTIPPNPPVPPDSHAVQLGPAQERKVGGYPGGTIT